MEHFGRSCTNSEYGYYLFLLPPPTYTADSHKGYLLTCKRKPSTDTAYTCKPKRRTCSPSASPFTITSTAINQSAFLFLPRVRPVTLTSHSFIIPRFLKSHVADNMSPAGAAVWHDVDRKQRPWFKSYWHADLSPFNLSKMSPLVGADLTV